MEAKLNNLNSVLPGFWDQAQAKDIALEVEKLKHKYLLNAVSILIQQIPDLQPAIESSLNEVGIKVPSRPPTGAESVRPGTGSSHHSNTSVR